MGQSEPLTRSQIIFITPFSAAFTIHGKLHNYDEPNHFHDPSRYRYFDFSSTNFTMQITY
jgi:hypothetical protein